MGTGGGQPAYNNVPGYIELNAIAQYGMDGTPNGDANENNNVTNLMDVSGTAITAVTWDPNNPQSAFEYMPNATFATFNTFDGISTNWVRDYPSDFAGNTGFRFGNSMENGLNYSVHYAYRYSANPDVNLNWHSATTGAELTVQRASATAGTFVPNLATDLSASQVPTNFATGLPVTLLLHDGTKTTYYAAKPVTGATTNTTDGVELRFTESLHRMHSLGAAFDYALETESAPVVLRAEFLYDKDDKQAVVDKHLLSIGDLTNALKMEDADYFKYVLGADITVMTNLMLSAQFIQFRNLDYVDTSRTCTTQTGNTLLGDTAITTGSSFTTDCSTYTGDLATLHLSNGMNKAEKNKEFVSFFMSKPFGESQLGRWNNIIMWEEGGGYWDRFDLEYSFTDNLSGSAALNVYWGDSNTQFGQLSESANIQLGVKYIFE